ncbi:MAG: peptide chain release factor 2 [Actinobacteria bacterium]|nr:peptide chain release factor 2 [Actinomycetota bacterium]MCL5446741.1 peptide chain release factor 2 [Actinomycetota bacterium]
MNPAEASAALSSLAARLGEAEVYMGLDKLRARKEELDRAVCDAHLWDDPDHAKMVTSDLAGVEDDIAILDDLRRRLDDSETLLALVREAGDDWMDPELPAACEDLDRRLAELEIRSLLSGEHDALDAVVELHAGAGGTDAQDWCEILMRIYIRWAERNGFGVEVDEVTEGQEAGLLSATFIIKGRYAYGMLSAERGVHRLVRISPFDSQHRRHTSFASLDVVPFLEDIPEVEIDEKELRVDTYRSAGAGGQHVNKTDSAVRLTHLPTGLVVTCQNQRSQHQNKARALQILAARLAERIREQRRREMDSLAGPKEEVAWGSQIRSYTLAPFQLVKDHRTQEETGNVEAVLDGDISRFIEAELRRRRSTASA